MMVKLSVLALCVAQTTAFITQPLGRRVGALYQTDGDIQFSKVSSPPPSQVRIQGGKLQTFSFQEAPDRLMVCLAADDPDTIEGRLLNARVEWCEGPDNIKQTMVITSGKGKYRPFRCAIETPTGYGSLFVRNIASIEFPIIASVLPAKEMLPPGGVPGLVELSESVFDMSAPKTLQGGGSVFTYPIGPEVSCVKVTVQTEGRPVEALVELVQGPNSLKHTIDIYSEDGTTRPFCAMIETPGGANTVRIVNKAPTSYPLTMCVEPFFLDKPPPVGAPPPRPTLGNTVVSRLL